MHTMTATHSHVHHARRSRGPLEWVVQAFSAHRQRAKLENLDAHLLEDIGIDPATAHREASRPFWDLP